MKRKQYVLLMVLMIIAVIFVSCGEDYSEELAQLNIQHAILQHDLDEIRKTITENTATTISEKAFTGQPTYKVTRIIDGDTVKLMMDGQDTTVRLIGVDTPETVHPQKPVERYGKEASMFTTNLLKGEEVYIERQLDNTVDKYGRTLLYLYRASDGLFVNLEIVRQGYGHAYTIYPFRYMEMFTHYEARARESSKGLWSNVNGNGNDVYVYITRTGKKYHLASCIHGKNWSGSVRITLEEAKRRGKTPCQKCTPPR